MVSYGVVDDGEGLEAQEVHLEHPDLVEAVHVVLRHDHRVAVGGAVLPGLHAHRHVVVERAGRDDHARRVHRRVPRQSLERDRVVEELLVALVQLVELLDLLEVVDRFLDGERLARLVRDQLGDAVGLRGLEAERPSDVADDRAALHGAERDDLPDGVLAVLLACVLDDLAPALVAEVDVDIGHRDPLGVQEALEQQIEPERIEVRDPKRVRDERARRRPAARADGDVVVPRPLDEVGGDEEVSRVAGPADDPHLVVEALLDLRRRRIPVAPLGAREREVLQVVVLGGVALGQREGRQVVLLLEEEVDLGRDPERVLDDVGTVGEPLDHLLGVLEVEPLVVAHATGIVAVLAEPDAEQDVVRLVVLGRQEVRVVRGDDGQPELIGEREDLCVELRLTRRVVRLDLEVVAAVEEVRVPLGRGARALGVAGDEVAGDLAGHARRRDDDPLVVAGQDLAVDARAVVEALRVADRGELDEVLVADAVTGEQHQMVVRPLALSRPGAVAAVAGGDVGLHPQNRLDPLLPRGLVEGPRAEHAPVVGEREPRHLVLLGLSDQVVDAVGPVEERVLRVRMEVDEAQDGRPAETKKGREDDNVAGWGRGANRGLWGRRKGCSLLPRGAR
jgi:hypothetical protein